MKSIVSRISLVYLILLWIIPTIEVLAEVPRGFTVTQTNHDNKITFKGTLTANSYKYQYLERECKGVSSYTDCIENPHKYIKNLKSPKDLNFGSCEVSITFQRYNNTFANDKDVRRHITTTMPCTFVGINKDPGLNTWYWGQKFYCTFDNSHKGIVAAGISINKKFFTRATVDFADCTDEKIIDQVYKDNYHLIFSHKHSLEDYWLNED